MGLNINQEVVFSIEDIDITVWMIVSLAIFVLLLIVILIFID